uniref:Uncharacterized protein n=1 Tax=Oryza nivara TaxID=4536 RepID=A0A0E0FZ39_ORYNI
MSKAGSAALSSLTSPKEHVLPLPPPLRQRGGRRWLLAPAPLPSAHCHAPCHPPRGHAASRCPPTATTNHQPPAAPSAPAAAVPPGLGRLGLLGYRRRRRWGGGGEGKGRREPGSMT